MIKKIILLPLFLLIILIISGCSNTNKIESSNKELTIIKSQQDKELENKIKCQNDAEAFRLKLEEKINSSVTEGKNDVTFNYLGDYQYTFNKKLNTCLFYGNYIRQYPNNYFGSWEYIYDVYTNDQWGYTLLSKHPGFSGVEENKSDSQLAAENDRETKFKEKKKELFGN